MSYRPCGMLETDFLISLFWGQQWSESHHEYKRIGLSLLQQVVMVQKPAGAGGSGIKQKQSCINLHLLLLFDKKKMNVCTESWSSAISMPPFLPNQTHTHAQTHTRTRASFPTSLISCQRTLCVLERSLHLFSRCGDGELLEVPRCCIHTWPIRPA